jgi:DNA-binding response OmpR family regulator
MSSFPPQPRAGLRIMIVDDNPDEFTLIEAGFRHHSCAVILQTATIAHLALVDFALCDLDLRPELALVDINMPAIDGFGLAGEFISHGLKTILMSTHVDAVRCERATALGALALLKKPGTFAGYAEFAARVMALTGRPLAVD